VLAMLVASLVFVHRVLRSHLGRAFEALRGSPVASDCMGVSVYRYKVYAFVVSAGLAGLAGALYAYSEQYISPNTYNFELTVLFLLAIIMGGRKTRTGALLGAAIIVLLPKMLDDLSLFRSGAVILAAAMAIGIHDVMQDPREIVIVEPGTAACVARALARGNPDPVPGTLDTCATMLACGEASAAAVRILLPFKPNTVSVDDERLRSAVTELRRAGGPATTPSGAAGVAGLLEVQSSAATAVGRPLSNQSVVLVVVTEGPLQSLSG